jgi:membrane-associated phospholipid phosphatase
MHRRLCLVSETWAPEINGVAHTLGHLSREATTRGHRLGLPAARCPSADLFLFPSLSETWGNVRSHEPARDRYSFPSGHTMHAVTFLVLTANHLPWLAPWLVPLVLLIALSRVGLGLHYLSDVVAGALLGLLFAGASLALVG